MLAPGNAVSVRLSADAVLGTSGRRTVIWSVTIESGTNVTVAIRNGTLDTDTVLWGPTAAATSPGRTYHFPNGLQCSAGAFIDMEGTSPRSTITYTQHS